MLYKLYKWKVLKLTNIGKMLKERVRRNLWNLFESLVYRKWKLKKLVKCLRLSVTIKYTELTAQPGLPASQIIRFPIFAFLQVDYKEIETLTSLVT